MHDEGEHFIEFRLYCKSLVSFVLSILLATARNENLLLEESLCGIQNSQGKSFQQRQKADNV